MKKYLIILIAFLALSNCAEKDDFEPLSNLVVPDLFTPSLNKIDETSINNKIAISVNDFSSAADISQGVVSRSWTISDGTRFLKDTFKRTDSLNLTAFIDPELGSSNWRPTVHVLFQEAGEKTLTLNNYFPQAVSYLGKDAVQSGDLWRLTNTLTFDVYGYLNAEASVTNAATSEEVILTASQNPSSDNTTGFTTLTLEAGTSLKFKDLTTIGRPDGRVWNFESGTPETSEDEEVDILYNRPGEYTATITVNRNKKGKTLFPAEQTKTLPVLVKVIPSSQPFVISANGMAVDDNNPDLGTTLLSFGVNGILETLENSAGNFTVDIVNGAFTSSSSPNSVRISSGNESVLELVLSEPIFNTDTVTISYNGTSIKSIDDRVLQVFTNEPVTNLFQNFLTDATNPSFEEASDVPNNANLIGYSTFRRVNEDGSLIYSRSTERATDGSASVKASMLFPIFNGNNGLTNTVLANSNVPAGSYRIELDVYVEPGSTIKAMFLAGPGIEFKNVDIDLASLPQGEWVTVAEVRNFNNPLSGNLNFAFNNPGNPGVTGIQTVYFDNLRFIGLEDRP